MFLKKYLLLLYFYYIYFIYAKKFYCGYKVYRINNEPDDSMNNIDDFLTKNENNPGISIWMKTKTFTDVMVSKKQQNYLEKYLNASTNDYSILINNVQRFLNGNKKEATHGVRRISSKFFKFDDFLSHDEITEFLYNMAETYPEICEVTSFGKTYEKRNMLHAIITDPNNMTKDKKVVLYQGGIHAREWVSPATLLYFLKEILTNYEDYKHILSDLIVIVAPLVNPDGYAYSTEKEPFWRKNRRPIPGSKCYGVDLNRNFAYHWNESGTSSDPCSDIYSGEAYLTEPETQNINLLVEKYSKNLKLYIDVHSYGKYLFYPYGYKKGSPPNKGILHAVAEKITNAITEYSGSKYIIGSSAEVLYESAGGADDFVLGIYNVPLAYTLELPGKGFHIATKNILPFASETFQGLLEGCKIVHDMDFN